MILGTDGCRGGYIRTYDGSVYWLVNQFNSPALTGTLKQQALERVVHLEADGLNAVLSELIAATPEDKILHNQIMLVPPLDDQPATTAPHAELDAGMTFARVMGPQVP